MYSKMATVGMKKEEFQLKRAFQQVIWQWISLVEGSQSKLQQPQGNHELPR